MIVTWDWTLLIGMDTITTDFVCNEIYVRFLRENCHPLIRWLWIQWAQPYCISMHRCWDPNQSIHRHHCSRWSVKTLSFTRLTHLKSPLRPFKNNTPSPTAADIYNNAEDIITTIHNFDNRLSNEDTWDGENRELCGKTPWYKKEKKTNAMMTKRW